jgi:hypothetical protein
MKHSRNTGRSYKEHVFHLGTHRKNLLLSAGGIAAVEIREGVRACQNYAPSYILAVSLIEGENSTASNSNCGNTYYVETKIDEAKITNDDVIVVLNNILSLSCSECGLFLSQFPLLISS